jgi:hypothetical protein
MLKKRGQRKVLRSDTLRRTLQRRTARPAGLSQRHCRPNRPKASLPSALTRYFDCQTTRSGRVRLESFLIRSSQEGPPRLFLPGLIGRLKGRDYFFPAPAAQNRPGGFLLRRFQERASLKSARKFSKRKERVTALLFREEPSPALGYFRSCFCNESGNSPLPLN